MKLNEALMQFNDVLKIFRLYRIVWISEHRKKVTYTDVSIEEAMFSFLTTEKINKHHKRLWTIFSGFHDPFVVAVIVVTAPERIFAC
jgi:hypothetical protein